MDCEKLFKIFKKNELDFFTGVPDSTFKGWMSFLADNEGEKLKNIVACNECEAIAVAAGYHLATKKIAVVYMQNSGLGKTVNPLTSLCDPEVYSIPLIMMIGWRGKPGEKDEPQHKKMGRITIDLLQTLEIPYEILPKDPKKAEGIIQKMKKTSLKNNRPTALIVESGVIDNYEIKREKQTPYELNREDAVKQIAGKISRNDIVISTTGKISRELYEFRVASKSPARDFYTVGSMGCSASIALGIALEKPNKKIFVFDGDGAVIMQMGALSTIGHYHPKNFYHIVFDNESHESTGGQPTNSGTVNFAKIALNCGYKFSKTIKNKNELEKAVGNIIAGKNSGPIMLIVKVQNGSRADLGRPKETPIENKNKFLENF